MSKEVSINSRYVRVRRGRRVFALGLSVLLHILLLAGVFAVAGRAGTGQVNAAAVRQASLEPGGQVLEVRVVLAPAISASAPPSPAASAPAAPAVADASAAAGAPAQAAAPAASSAVPAISASPPQTAGEYTESLLVQLEQRIADRLVYPMQARRAGMQGEVQIALQISPEGQLADQRIVQSSGQQLLDSAALQTVQHSFPLSNPRGKIIHLTVSVLYRLA